MNTRKVNTSLQAFEIWFVVSKEFFEFAMPYLHGPLLLGHLWSYMRASLEQTMPFTLLDMKPTEFAFHEIAFGIVLLASGFRNSLAILDHRRLQYPRNFD